MKVKQLRLAAGCHALKGAALFVPNKNTKIEHMGGTTFMVYLGENDPVMVSIANGGFAVLEKESSKVPVSDLKK